MSYQYLLSKFHRIVRICVIPSTSVQHAFHIGSVCVDLFVPFRLIFKSAELTNENIFINI